MDLKTYQALAQQLEQIADLLLADHADRLKFRNEVLRKLAALPFTHDASSTADKPFLTQTQAKTLWAVLKTIGPWALTAAVGVFHLVMHYVGHR